MLDDLGMTWLHPGGLPSTERMLKLLELDAESRVLDLGCGVGSTTRLVRRRHDCSIVGIDRDPEMIAKAKRRSRARRYRGIRYEVMDGGAMSFPDGSFDVVIVQSVACFNDKQSLLSEVWRILKPGGRVALNEVTWLRQPSEGVAKVTRATVCETFGGALLPEEWIEVLGRVGFTELRHETFGFKPVAAYQILREEGLINTVRTFARVLTNANNLMRLSAVSDYFKRFPGYFGYGIYIGTRPRAAES
jgi:SAM-dependent methyltransferase